MEINQAPTAPAACASPDGASPPLPPPTTAAGAQTARAVGLVSVDWSNDAALISVGDAQHEIRIDWDGPLPFVMTDSSPFTTDEDDAAIAELLIEAHEERCAEEREDYAWSVAADRWA